MASENEKMAPYAPTSNVLEVIRRYRERGLPETLSATELTRLGIPQGNASRTLQALRFLELINDAGQRTAYFEQIRSAPASDYPEILADILRKSYRDVFTIIDPATATPDQIEDAFRIYSPVAQRTRMVTLFLGLCREAGIVPGGPMPITRRPRAQNRANSSPTPKPPRHTTQDALITTASPKQPAASLTASSGRYALLEGILTQLPTDGQWSQDRRDRWIQALVANLDLLVEVVDPHQQ